MHIYIDESGSFVYGPGGRRRVNFLGALVIPDAVHTVLFERYEALRSQWLGSRPELRGAELSPDQLVSILSLLGQYDVIFETIGVDLHLLSSPCIDRLKLDQADSLAEGAWHEVDLGTDDDRLAIADRLRNEANQLFIQGFLFVALVRQLIWVAPSYYVQRNPTELAAFRWIIDAKDHAKIPTPSEELWTTLVVPLICSSTYFGTLPDVDYSAMKRFWKPVARPAHPESACVPGLRLDSGTDVRMLLTESFKRMDSRASLGLELVDILVNAITRLVNGKLDRALVQRIGRLMVQRNPRTLHVMVEECDSKGLPKVPVPYSSHRSAIEQAAKPMFTPRYMEVLARISSSKG